MSPHDAPAADGTVGDGLVRERQGSVLVARLERPGVRNALDGPLMTALGAVVVEAEADPGIRVLVLTGTGDKAFCAGMDLRAFAEAGRASVADSAAADGFHRLLHGTVRLPVVGAANGTALAAGLELLLGCDVIVAADTACFGLPEVTRGLFPGGSGTLIGTRVPLGVALEMALTGEPVDAGRALGIGLVNAVVPAAEVLPTALAYAERIAANGPLGVAAAKELVRLAVADRARAAERLPELQRQVFASADAREGAAAFVEKRPPQWQGR